MPDLLHTLGSTTFSNASLGGRNYDYTKIYNPDKPGDEAEENSRVWNIFLDEAEIYDADMIEGFHIILDGLLVFASLFSGVVTTLIAQTSQALQPDNSQIMASLLFETNQLLRAIGNGSNISAVPTASLGPGSPTYSLIDVWVNGLFFTSLALAVSTAFLTVLAKQWIHAYTATVPGGAKTRALIRQFRFRGLMKWRLGDVIESLPLILHSSVAIFFSGLTLYVSQLSFPLCRIVNIITVFTFAFYFGTSMLPAFDIASPYRIPFMFSLAKPLAFILRAANYGFLYLWYKLRRKREFVSWPNMARKSLKVEEHSQVFLISHFPWDTAASHACDALYWVFNHSSNRSVKKVVVEGVCALLDKWNSDDKFQQSSDHVVLFSENRNLFLSAVEYSLSQLLDMTSTKEDDPEQSTWGKLIGYIINISRSQTLLDGPIADSRDWRKRIENALITAYKAAVSRRYHVLSRRLLDWGSPTLLRSGRANHVLSHCVMEGDGEDINYLLDRGVDLYHRNIHGWTALHLAAYNGKLDAIMVLVEREPDLIPLQAVHHSSFRTCTTFDLAVESSNSDAVGYLLDHGANPSPNALHVAMQSPSVPPDKRLEMIEFLLDRGWDRTFTDASGSTPVDLAHNLGLSSIVYHLEHYQTVMLQP